MRWTGILAVVALACAPVAAAQLAKGQGVILGQADAKAGLFGIDMYGYSVDAKYTWRECINPRGETLYYFLGQIEHGRLAINAKGVACFTYLEDSNYKIPNCYSVERNGTGFIFRGGGTFVTTKVVTGVKECRSDDLIS